MDQRNHFTGLLAEIRAERAQTRRYRLALHLRRALATLGRWDAVQRQLTLQLHVVERSLAQMALAEAEVREQLCVLRGSLVSPHG
jgi:hypothetical protein